MELNVVIFDILYVFLVVQIILYYDFIRLQIESHENTAHSMEVFENAFCALLPKLLKSRKALLRKSGSGSENLKKADPDPAFQKPGSGSGSGAHLKKKPDPDLDPDPAI